MKRRIFLKLSGLTAGLLAFFPASAAFAKKVALGLEKVTKLQVVGGWTILEVKDRDILFVRDAEDSVRAFNPVCTHMQCIVGYDPGQQKIVCPCHGSTYNLDGHVEIGPAPADLERYETTVKDGRIILTLPD